MCHFQTNTQEALLESILIGKSICNHCNHWSNWTSCSPSKQKVSKAAFAFHSNHCSLFHTGPHKHCEERLRCDWGILTVISNIYLQAFVPVYLQPVYCSFANSTKGDAWLDSNTRKAVKSGNFASLGVLRPLLPVPKWCTGKKLATLNKKVT